MLVRRDLEEFVTVPEGRIHFVKQGTGAPIVLIHSLGISSWIWHRVMEPLGEHFTCYAFDVLGHGESDKPSRYFTIPDHATALDHAMQVMNIHRAHIIGGLAGGVLAVELAASYPDRIDRLVLVATPVREPSSAPGRLKEAESNYDENDMPLPRSIEEWKAYTAFVNPRPEWVEKCNELRTQCGTWAHRTQEVLAWYDVRARLPHIKASATLVLTGEHSLRPDSDDVLLHNIPNASKVVLPGLGLMSMVEGPEAFVSAMLDFLK